LYIPKRPQNGQFHVEDNDIINYQTCAVSLAGSETLAQQLTQSEDDHVNEMSRLLQKHTAHSTELQSHLETSEIQHTAHDTGHLTVGVGEGLFEIHIQRLQLSPEGLRSLMDEVRHFMYLLILQLT
jgi:hypothetical protein